MTVSPSGLQLSSMPHQGGLDPIRVRVVRNSTRFSPHTADDDSSICQLVKEAGFLKERRMSVEKFDNDGEFRKGCPAEGRWARGVAIKQLSELVFENIEALCDVLRSRNAP